MFNILKAIRGLQNSVNLPHLATRSPWNEGAWIPPRIRPG